MTMEEKKRLAHQLLSGPSKLDSGITPAYRSVLERVKVGERAIPTRVGDCRAVVVEPPDRKKPSPLYINIHGGGFVRPYVERDTMFSGWVAETLGCLVLDLDYRLAPDYPFPIPQKECYDVVEWAVKSAGELGIDTGRIAVGGHSAGGNLAATIAMQSCRTKAFRLALCIIDYACLDMATNPADKPRDKDAMPIENMLAYDHMCVEDEIHWLNPMLSPVYAAAELLRDLPPTLIISAGRDTLRVDSHKYARLLAEAGVEVELREFADSRHGFVIRCLDEWEAAHALYFDALRKAFGHE